LPTGAQDTILPHDGFASGTKWVVLSFGKTDKEVFL
jgi:hypothetical protein